LRDVSRHTAFVQLLTQYERQIRRFVLTMVPSDADADDILQDTSLAMWNKFDRYDASQSFVAWACGFARLEVLKHFEADRTRRRYFTTDVIDLLADERAAVADESTAREAALRACLRQLSDDDRALLEARYEHRTPLRQLAEQQGRPVHWFHRALMRIRRTLAECIQRRLAAEDQR